MKERWEVAVYWSVDSHRQVPGGFELAIVRTWTRPGNVNYVLITREITRAIVERLVSEYVWHTFHSLAWARGGAIYMDTSTNAEA